MVDTTTTNPYPFLTGGGEMGERTRNYDWSTTALGTPDQWPLSLRTTVGIVLHSAFPMFLFWGPDLICFYNDAYRVSLGDDGKHPAVGKRGAEVWTEIWDLIGPMIDRVLRSGEPTFFENQLVPIHRNSRLEDVYWTYSYSPAYDDAGQINGVFVACTETTKQVVARQQLTASREQFRRLIEEAPVAMALFSGPQFVITSGNERVLQFWGRSREQVMGKPLFEALPEASGQGFEELLTGVYTTGERFVARELPVMLERKGQLEQTYIDFVYEPFREIDGVISGVTVVCVEITEQVLARQKVEQSEAKLRAVIDASPVAISLLTGPDHVIENPNQAFIDILGKGPGINGKPMAAAMPELLADSQPFVRVLDEVYASGTPFHAYDSPVDIVQHGVMNRGYYNFSYTPLFDAAGKVYAILDIAVDVTKMVVARQALQTSESRYRTLATQLEKQVQERTEELAATNEELAATNEELAATNEELTATNNELIESNNLLGRSNDNLQKFAYVASHDLQEPLRKIQQFGDLLKKQYADSLGGGVDYLERMQSAASRMSTLIRDLLNFSRISTQRDTNVPVPLNEVVTAVLTDLDLRIQEAGAVVTVDLLPTIQGDRPQVEQLFQNLISNALKFQRAGIGPVIQITNRLVVHQDLPPSVKPARSAPFYYRISVADNGIGFDEKYVDRIFEVFQRLHGKNEFAGTGIGLAICEKVVANHGGAITATGQPGQGATFSVYFPA